MEEKIFPNVEYKHGADIPSKPFFRNTQKVFLKTSDEGLTFLGKTYSWSDINHVELKFFNSNPYIQLDISGNTVHSLFFESKFYYRKKDPWFGGSKFFTTEFVKLLEEKGLYSLNDLKNELESNSYIPSIHKLWNAFFWIFPPVLLFITIYILYLGFTNGAA